MSQVVNRRGRGGGVDPMANPRGDGDRPLEQQSTGELVQHASEQIARLVREEFALAKLELSEKGRHAGKGAGMLGAGGLLALYGLGLLLIVAVLALAEVMPAWLAALIVTVAVFLVAGILAVLGRRQVQQAVPPMPEETADSVRADVDRVAAAVRDRSTAGHRPARAGRAVPDGSRGAVRTTAEQPRMGDR